ncbi:MAG TPA: DUF58 domain-containing protein [Blastocatellia bacterium]|nr:DUF58 domain-containing protein [Blastocatellia bacterium]HMX28626.1 DUF58 domain-containing protein [Blastocatellia bacterium]HMY72024.1 DUF58 domain-containing protein [Blastocatellia bacterium]HMZ21566.1 DUF58 domain-containing protein [Blastocatellia bacterium]HNG29748.1 DUF58 domain-containing protein [Blastocatellia bacterium]
MFTFLRRKKSLRFVLISALLTGAAMGAGLIAAVASQIGEYDVAALSSKVALGLAILIVLYVAPQLARSVQWRSEYAVQLPNAGLIFLAVILMVTIISLSSGNNLLYLVLAVLLATMIVSMAAARLNLKRLKPSVHYPDHIFAGEAVPFEITLANERRWLPVFSMTVDLVEERPAIRNGKDGVRTTEQKAFALGYFPIVPARVHARMRIERSFSERGVYPVIGFVVSTGFPFGFVEQRRLVEWRGEIVVYPQPKPLGEFEPLPPFLQGRFESRAKGSGSDLYAIRQYFSSDHHHHIDWKATAKTSRLMVREFTRDDEWRVSIIFDARVNDSSAADADIPQKFERAITFAASLVTYFIEVGAEVRLRTADEDSGFGTSQAHHFAMLRTLAQLAPKVSDSEDAPVGEDDWARGLEVLIAADGSTSLFSPSAERSHSR